jgi:hypothetical protein
MAYVCQFERIPSIVTKLKLSDKVRRSEGTLLSELVATLRVAEDTGTTYVDTSMFICKLSVFVVPTKSD